MRTSKSRSPGTRSFIGALSRHLDLRRAFAPLAVACLLCSSGPSGASELAALVSEDQFDAIRELGPEVLPELVDLYRQGDEEGRAEVAWVFYQLGWKSEAAQRVLIEDVRTEHQSLRIAAQYALGRVSNDDIVVDVLLENMRSRDRWLFRDKAACGLAYDQIHLTERQKVRLFAELIGSLSDPDLGTRALAIQILAVRTGQNKGFLPEAPPVERAVALDRWWRWLAEYRTQIAAS